MWDIEVPAADSGMESVGEFSSGELSAWRRVIGRPSATLHFAKMAWTTVGTLSREGSGMAARGREARPTTACRYRLPCGEDDREPVVSCDTLSRRACGRGGGRATLGDGALHYREMRHGEHVVGHVSAESGRLRC